MMLSALWFVRIYGSVCVAFGLIGGYVIARIGARR